MRSSPNINWKLCKPAIDGSPMTEMHRQHPPAAARAHQIAHRIDHFAELDFARTPSAPGLRHQRRDPRPFLIRQIRRVALGLSGDFGHPAPLLACPHQKCESHSQQNRNPQKTNFQTGSYRAVSTSAISPLSSAAGSGGQPGMCKSTGTTVDTAPSQA